MNIENIYTNDFPELKFSLEQALELEQFREMDYYAVENYYLPIELMMENAGLHLARLTATISRPGSTIKIGVGNGNNGGGGLVAARRLASWGYKVFVDPFVEITKPLPKTQLQRALEFGALQKSVKNPDVWIDAYLGFSQKLPLAPELLQRIENANKGSSINISLDIPTGFSGERNTFTFKASKVLTLAAPKKILFHLPAQIDVLVADIGIPAEVYKKFEINSPPFYQNSIIQLKR
ncbi:NAD(P)H-hydrate epimerase [Marinilabilia salmonicolor]|uniref:NAD(P)H-hydrate epimerase n=1 Tax=Marinilabilia salmonicolor TaxID=989 RepID=A0A368VFA6_9BACT|nr:NAD(P)H-hydrate epimerase [Marinilabilia salmonicolor]RCW38334.1 NAD(P)H-hydrate epimerase [Marinilabilia salmonicolor]